MADARLKNSTSFAGDITGNGPTDIQVVSEFQKVEDDKLNSELGPLLSNVASWGTASQSTTQPGFEAAHAVDGCTGNVSWFLNKTCVVLNFSIITLTF